MCGSYSSISSIVHLCRRMSSRVWNLCTFCSERFPYGMGWRTTTGFFPMSLRIRAIRLVVWLLPLPVRTAHTATTGTRAASMVWSAPSRRKSAPSATRREACSITCWCETSEYEKTASSILSRACSASIPLSAMIGMPSGYRGPARSAG